MVIASIHALRHRLPRLAELGLAPMKQVRSGGRETGSRKRYRSTFRTFIEISLEILYKVFRMIIEISLCSIKMS